MSGMSTSVRRIRVVLAVAPERFADVVRLVRDVGLLIEDEQPLIGTIAGIATEESLPILEGIDGVDAVERDRTFQLHGPDSPLQ